LFPQPGRHWDIYSAERSGDGFAPRQALGAGVNTTPSAADVSLQDSWEFNPEITVDGKTLLFTSLRRGGFGFGDIYVSHLVNGEWTAARNLGPLVNVRRIPLIGNFYHISTKGLDLF